MNVSRLQKKLSPILSPLSLAYGQIMRLRRFSYEQGLKKSWHPGVPVISVGNISSGGTGKTPVVSFLLDWAEQKKLTPVVLTRGYKARPKHLPYVVAQDSPAVQAGDEPLSLAKAHPKARIMVDQVRTRAGKQAMAEFAPDLFILDDGFQHLAVRRDTDLVLFKPDDLGQGWGKVIPAGEWREPEQALARAQAFLVKSDPGREDELRGLAEKRLKKFGKPVFLFSYKYTGLARLDTDEQIENFEQKPYVLATGVGAPHLVLACAKDYFGQAPVKFLSYPDHHFFTEKDIIDIRQAAKGRPVVVTDKDAVKLSALAPDFWRIRAKIVITSGSGVQFLPWLEQNIRRQYEEEKQEKKHTQGS